MFSAVVTTYWRQPARRMAVTSASCRRRSSVACIEENSRFMEAPGRGNTRQRSCGEWSWAASRSARRSFGSGLIGDGAGTTTLFLNLQVHAHQLENLRGDLQPALQVSLAAGSISKLAWIAIPRS